MSDVSNQFEMQQAEPRVALRTALAGAVLVCAIMTVFSALTQNSILGEATNTLMSRSAVSGWSSTVIPWMFATGVGSFCACLLARARSSRDGVLLGLVTWASALLLFAVLTSLGMLTEPPTTFEHEAPAIGVGFLANVGAVLAAIVGGAFAVWLSRPHLPEREKTVVREVAYP